MNGYKITNQNSLHFLTITVVSWIDLFTRDEYRQIILNSFRYCQKERGLFINAYVIMSNHIHIICHVEEPHILSNVIRDFKKFTSKAILEAIASNPMESRKNWMLKLFADHGEFNKKNKSYQLWQQNNHPIELVSPKWINQKLDYIHLNPVRNGIVEKETDYVYSSALNYAGKNGLIEVEIIELPNDIGFIPM